MSDYPHVRTLLAELLDLDSVEMQLPLDILINVHRAQLRAPLEAAAGLAYETDGLYAASHGVELQLEVWYPDLAGGGPMRGQSDISRLRLELKQDHQGMQDDWDMTRQLLESALSGGIQVHESLGQLYALTLPKLSIHPRVQLLERELEVAPMNRAMILDLSRGTID